MIHVIWALPPRKHITPISYWNEDVSQTKHICDTNLYIFKGYIRLWHNPSDCTMALGSTQPPTDMSTRYISWGVKVAGT